MSPADPKSPHTMADHLLGALAGHHHGDGDDHDHDHDAMDGVLPAGTTDQVVLTSIGVDVGSSGTQIAFSRLTLEQTGGRISPQSRQTLYQSPVSLTPFAADGRIDEAILSVILDHAFSASNLVPDEIDCGVVILTGAARERGNAETVTRQLATICGDIVSASAGHHMEARLAAHGSGALQRSATTGRRFLNVDIGGATTKLAICSAGEIEATAALAIGGRQVATDPTGRIIRLEPAARRWAQQVGIDWQLGGVAPVADLARVAQRMADALVVELAGLRQPVAPTASTDDLYLTDRLIHTGPIDGIIVSGGVGEYVYGRETRDFCDLGRPLGRAFAARIDAGALPWPLMPAAECIRATVLGASGYTVQLSGRTGCITSPAAVLPALNLQVLHPPCALSAEIDATEIAATITAHLAEFEICPEHDVVLAFRWRGLPDYVRLRAFAEGMTASVSERLQAGHPLRVILDGDIAASLGAILRDEIGVPNDLLLLDGIELADFDYVDLGRLRLPSGTVPVTIKTLVFRDDPVQNQTKAAHRGQRGRTNKRGAG